MIQYINKSDLVAEIDEIVKALRRQKPNPFGSETQCLADAEIEVLNLIKGIIDTLETKDVNLEKRRLFNEGVWYAVQHLVLSEDEPTLAQDLLRAMNVDKKEWLDIQCGTGYQNDKMKRFLKSI